MIVYIYIYHIYIFQYQKNNSSALAAHLQFHQVLFLKSCIPCNEGLIAQYSNSFSARTLASQREQNGKSPSSKWKTYQLKHCRGLCSAYTRPIKCWKSIINAHTVASAGSVRHVFCHVSKGSGCSSYSYPTREGSHGQNLDRTSAFWPTSWLKIVKCVSSWLKAAGRKSVPTRPLFKHKRQSSEWFHQQGRPNCVS